MRLPYSAKVADTTPHLMRVRRASQQAVESRVASQASPKSPVWRRASFAATAGVLFGIIAAVWLRPGNAPVQRTEGWSVEKSGPRQINMPSAVTASQSVKETSSGATADPAEVKRLKVRNRRLEALVQVLKKRAQSGKNGVRATASN
jgi:hypothetical protein